MQVALQGFQGVFSRTYFLLDTAVPSSAFESIQTILAQQLLTTRYDSTFFFIHYTKYQMILIAQITWLLQYHQLFRGIAGNW